MEKFERKLAWEALKGHERDKVFGFVEEYKDFLDKAKTEREVVDYVVEAAVKNGFKSIGEAERLEPGDRVYMVYKDKMVILAVIGRRGEEQGIRLVASHGDAPRLDPKPLPVMEDPDANVSLLQTGWYGGVVRYQWVNIPLALHGVVALKDGRKVDIRIGEDGGPVLLIPDLLPHLSRKRLQDRKARQAVKGEELKIVLGNIPLEEGEEKEKFKAAVLKMLKDKYGISEEDLLSADLEVVPALKAMDVGLDGSMVAGYGQDDRVSVFTSLRAILDVDMPEYTCLMWVVDKEEIGSETNTSAQSLFLHDFLTRIISLRRGEFREDYLRRCFVNSKAISADVDTVIHPMHKDLYDKANAGRMGCGIIVSKVGSMAGKYRGAEAHAEYMAWIRRILDENNVPWQPGLLVSKADEELGGGGTIAVFIARLGMDVVDAGCGVMGMHSPYELTSKVDVYSCYLAYRTFYTAEE